MPKLTPLMDDDLAFGRCLECQTDLEFMMEEECIVAYCCLTMYTTPLLRIDLVTATNEDGEVYE